MARKNEPGLIIPAQYFKQIAKLPAEDVGVLVQSLVQYMQSPNVDAQDMSPRAEVIFEMLCDDVDAMIQSYREKQEKGRAAAEKQWRDRREGAHGCADDDRVPVGTHADPRAPTGEGGSDRVSMQIELNKTRSNRTRSEEDIPPYPPCGGSDPDPAPDDALPFTDADIRHTDESPEPEKPKRRRAQGALTPEQQARFDRFWSAYPKRVGKEQARKTWAKLDPDDALTETIIAGVGVSRTRDHRFRDHQFTPHASTWLNDKGWEDELPEECVDNRASPQTGGYQNGRHTGPAVHTDWDAEVAAGRAVPSPEALRYLGLDPGS